MGFVTTAFKTAPHSICGRRCVLEGTKVKSLTCAEQQQDLHAQILVVRDLQPDKFAGNLQHLLALVGHVGQFHPLPGNRIEKPEWFNRIYLFSFSDQIKDLRFQSRR